MASIGNDIVDLSDPGNLTPSSRFIQRVFTFSERSDIDSSENPKQTLWLIWSAKEAAYKALIKSQPSLIFAHQEFRVDLVEKNVRINDQIIPIQWLICKNFVHTVASIASSREDSMLPKDIRFSIRKYENPTPTRMSSLVRRMAIQLAIECLENNRRAPAFADSVLTSDLAVKKKFNNGLHLPPRIVCTKRNGSRDLKNRLSRINLSLSHDGNYASAAITLTDRKQRNENAT